MSPNAFWKLKKSTSKNKQLKLPEVYKKDGSTTTDPDEIKEEAKKEFEHRLRNRAPEPGWEGYVEATNCIVEEILREVQDNSPMFSMDEMEKAMREMKDRTSPDYFGIHTEIITKAGIGVTGPLLDMFNTIKARKVIPEEWRRVLITMIYKNKGSRHDLEKYRGIFLTVVVSKLFEKMLKARMKDPLERVSLFQSGSKCKKSAADNLFLLRSSVDYSQYLGDSLYITTYDFRQAFDSLWLQDCILVLQKLGVEDYILKLINEMNKKAIMIVQIKTPYGLTEPVDVTDIVKQGGILGSPMCSATTAEYCGNNKGISIGPVSIASLAFVDDIADLSTSLDDAVESHKNAIAFAKRKKLQLAPDKCYTMLVQSSKRKRNEVPELFVEGERVKEVSSIVYLGDVFNSKGNNDDLMDDRVRRGTATMISIQGFMRETSLGYHTLSVYILLHNAIFLPDILFNAQAWSNITPRNITQLTTLQTRYLKKMMGVRQSTANAFTFLELGVLPVKYEIHKRQLSFFHHILHLPEDDPVKKVWRHQASLPDHVNWWWSDIKNLMVTYSIELDEETIANMSKISFKKKVRQAISDQALKDLKAENKKLSRTQNINYNKIETQQYIRRMNPTAAKTIFKCRAKTLNIKDHMRYKFSDTACRWCGIGDETIDHIVNCGRSEVVSNVESILEKGMEIKILEEIAIRVKDFVSKVEI